MTVLQFAKSRGYNDIIYQGKWEGFDVYKPVLVSEKADQHAKIGYPLRILQKGSTIRLTTPKESLKCKPIMNL